MIREFFLVFVPIFVAMDAIGILPLFLGLTEGIEKHRRRKIIVEAFLTALLVAFLSCWAKHLSADGDYVSTSWWRRCAVFDRDDRPGQRPQGGRGGDAGGVRWGAAGGGPAVLTLMLADARLWITALAVAANPLIAMGCF